MAIEERVMETKEQVAQAFKTELQALLDRYGADLEAKDHWQGYAECGEDVRMTVDVPAIYDADHNCVREYTEIDLGRWMHAVPAETMCGEGFIMSAFMVGQRVVLIGQGGTKEIGTVVPSETGVTHGVWVFSPTKGYASDYAKDNVKPLPNGQL